MFRRVITNMGHVILVVFLSTYTSDIFLVTSASCSEYTRRCHWPELRFVFLCSCHRAFCSLWHHFLQFRNSDRLPATRVLTSHELGHYCTTNLWNWICRGMLLTRSLRTQKAGLSLSPRWYSTSSSLTACCAKPRLLPRWMRSLYIRLL